MTPSLTIARRRLVPVVNEWQEAAKRAFPTTVICHRRSAEAVSSFQILSTTGWDTGQLGALPILTRRYRLVTASPKLREPNVLSRHVGEEAARARR
jgi:hypothetical protein